MCTENLSLRRECLDQVVIFGEPHLRRILSAYVGYYNQARTHLALEKDAPMYRKVQRSGTISPFRSWLGCITNTLDMIFGKERENAMNMSNGAKAGSSATDPARGMALLRDPLLNKGTAFTEKERDALGLRGLLPAHVLSHGGAGGAGADKSAPPAQRSREICRAQRVARPQRGAVLSRRCDNIDEIQPLIYTPTVGLACQRFGHIFQRPRGIFISAKDRGHIAELLAQLAAIRRSLSL